MRTHTKNYENFDLNMSKTSKFGLSRSDAQRLLLATDNAGGDLSIHVALGRNGAASRVRGANRGIESVVGLRGRRLSSSVQAGGDQELQNRQSEHIRKRM